MMILCLLVALQLCAVGSLRSVSVGFRHSTRRNIHLSKVSMSSSVGGEIVDTASSEQASTPIDTAIKIDDTTVSSLLNVSSDISSVATTVIPSPHIPSYKELIGFAVPTLGIWLLQPILSLIDTSVVGLSKSTNIAELAAIGPGVAWVDSTTYLCYSIGMSFTNLYAVALADPYETKQQTVLSHAGFISIALGVLLTFIQFSMSGTMIRIISGTAKEVIPYGIAYARIRSLGSLVAIPMIIAQSAFLVQKDTLTPLVATLVGAAVNVVGDVLLVSFLNRGVVGAAIATTLSQVASFIYLLFRVHRSVVKDCEKRNLSIQSYLRDRMRVPSLRDVSQFASFSGPLFVILLIKAFLWSFTTFACSTVGAAKLAAHQITLNAFIFLAIFGDVTSQIAQTYLPSIFTSLQQIHTKKANESDYIKENSIIESNSKSNSTEDVTRRVLSDSESGTLKRALTVISQRVFKLSLGVAAFTAVSAIVMQTIGAQVSSIQFHIIFCVH